MQLTKKESLIKLPKLLTTGGSGYLAAHLINLIYQSYDITIIDRHLKQDRLLAPEAMSLIEKDLLYVDDFDFSVFDICIHTAYLNDLEAEKKLLEKIHKQNPQIYFVYFSSAAVYGELENSGLESFSIDSVLKPINDYGVYKVELENIVTEYFINHAILRIANPYGKEFATKGVHALFKSKIESQEEPVQLNINAGASHTIVRDMIFIDDLLEKIIKILELKKTGLFNISSGKAQFLEDFVEQINSKNKKLEFKYSGFKNTEIRKSVLQPSL